MGLCSGSVQHLKVTARIKEDRTSIPSKEVMIQVNVPSLFESWNSDQHWN